MTACETPRRRQQPQAVEPQVAFRFGAVHPPQSHAAAGPAGATRAVHQFVAQHHQRIFDLECFDRQVRGVGHVHVDTVEPVLVGACAGAAADGFEIDPEVPVPWVGAGEARSRAGAVASGDAALRCGLRQGADHQVGGALTGAGAAVDRGRMDGIHHGAGRAVRSR